MILMKSHKEKMRGLSGRITKWGIRVSRYKVKMVFLNDLFPLSPFCTPLRVVGECSISSRDPFPLPALLFFNTTLVGDLLKPLLEQQTSSSYAAPELGSTYPTITGNTNDTHSLAIDNTASMLIMAYAHAAQLGDTSLITTYYSTLQRWADFLVSTSFNFSSSTMTMDGILGVGSTNLALKTIWGVYSMGKINEAIRSSDTKYLNHATTLSQTWTQSAITDSHIKLDFDEPSSWGLMYNIFPADFYPGQSAGQFPLPLRSSQADIAYPCAQHSLYHAFYLSDCLEDWNLLTAATIPDNVPDVRNQIIRSVHQRMVDTSQQFPLPKQYNIPTGKVVAGNSGSPIFGAAYGLLALKLQNVIITHDPPVMSSKPSTGKDVGATVGDVIGAITGTALIAFGLYSWYRRRRLVRGQVSSMEDRDVQPKPFTYWQGSDNTNATSLLPLRGGEKGSLRVPLVTDAVNARYQNVSSLKLLWDEASMSAPRLLHCVPSPPTSTPSEVWTLSNVCSRATLCHGMFQQVHDFTIRDSQFIELPMGISGLESLLKQSMPDSFYDSAARYPPPRCHVGTRQEYISKITDWALGVSYQDTSMLWISGPFGVGKTAVAQSASEALRALKKLVAAIFFSRSNVNRDDPRRLFASIAYQIATTFPTLWDSISQRIHDDPALTTKSLSTQFEELLAAPLSQFNVFDSGIKDGIVVIDGLDECRGVAEQCEIIRIIAHSAENKTTPFRWLILSRPEDPIIKTIANLDHSVASSLYSLKLPVSREIDHEIFLYLTAEFSQIRRYQDLPDTWPSDEMITFLVDRSAGLWIYASTVIRFIDDKNSLGPEDQLRNIMTFTKDISAKNTKGNPLAEMDGFYTLIMQRVPPKIRTALGRILLLHSLNASLFLPRTIAIALSLSLGQFRHCCSFICSVIELQGSSSLTSMFMRFYHTSFLDFLLEPERSSELCIQGRFLDEYRKELLDMLYEVCSQSTDPSDIVLPPGIILPDGVRSTLYYYTILLVFWNLCSISRQTVDLPTAKAFSDLPFRKMLKLLAISPNLLCELDGEEIRRNIPLEFRDKIIRRGQCPTPRCTNREDVWILGSGENQAITLQDSDSSHLMLANNQDVPPDFQCCCGTIMREESAVLSLD
ncbi:hypothetical protein NP233_g6219 [Leucocoprinus birnbaumii]|uniref:NACHT domain-containing protein n=1 Tax=Leucocoprinus birnbaumii TaxID=56174 RepID=A0AAD5YTV4_9AGAR|nr:hypothetical protein NP233_g6219 [Leucocoprinus birnbaumii]